MNHLVEIRKTKHGEIPYSPASCYKYHSQKKFPNLIYKVGGILVFDTDEWDKMAEAAKAANIKKAAGLRSVKR